MTPETIEMIETKKRGKTMMTKRKNFFKTQGDAKTYLQGYKPQYVTDPRKDEMQVFRLKYPRGGCKYFVGTIFELDVVRYS